jgi:hypothetical protein
LFHLLNGAAVFALKTGNFSGVAFMNKFAKRRRG